MKKSDGFLLEYILGNANLPLIVAASCSNVDINWNVLFLSSAHIQCEFTLNIYKFALGFC